MSSSRTSIVIKNIPADSLRLLDQRVVQKGGDRAGYAREILLKELHSPTLEEILAPFRKEVEENGITDQELDSLFEKARQEVYDEQNTIKT